MNLPPEPAMEQREKYIARLIHNPGGHGLSETRMINTPQVLVARWARLKCQYSCRGISAPMFHPPQSPTAEDTSEVLETYRFGLLLRRDIQFKGGETGAQDLLSEFQRSLLKIEDAAFSRGYSRAFLYAVGNCIFCQGGSEEMRPCHYPGKTRPTLEAAGIDLAETLRMLGWEEYLIHKPGGALSLFGLLLLE